MAISKTVYKSPKAGQPLMTTISSGCKTPLLEVKFCNLVNAYYYPNSPSVPRHSVTCIADPLLHGEFLNSIHTIEKNEGVDTIIKNETMREGGNHLNTGKVLIKFQTKEKIPVYIVNDPSEENHAVMDMEDEFEKGSKIVVEYDILRYTKKNTMTTEHGLSFKPSAIYFYPEG